MFTGIVEGLGEVIGVHEHGTGRDLEIRSGISQELKVDQSVAHNGVCLTIVDRAEDTHRVTAVKETLERSTLGDLRPGDKVNLERSLRIGDRLDGHMVQGHVDAVTQCMGVFDRDGSWTVVFSLPTEYELLVPKGSVCLNGVSLTIADLDAQTFSVAVIPYTYEYTTFHALKPGMFVNVEFDVLGKYVKRMMSTR